MQSEGQVLLLSLGTEDKRASYLPIGETVPVGGPLSALPDLADGIDQPGDLASEGSQVGHDVCRTIPAQTTGLPHLLPLCPFPGRRVLLGGRPGR